MKINERYSRNLGAFSRDELLLIRQKRACVVGCGGLGGYVASCLARFGVGELTLIDGDEFSESNLNRQIFSSELNIGKNKALATLEALKSVNSEVAVTAHPVMLDSDNAPKLLAGLDIALDCLDNISARRILASACAQLGIPIIHGAISGFYGQVSCLFPDDETMDFLYPPSRGDEIKTQQGNPVFTAQLVSAVQSCEAVKLLAGREMKLRRRVLYVDMLENDYEIVEFI